MFAYKYPAPGLFKGIQSNQFRRRLPPSLSLCSRVIPDSRRPPDEYSKPTCRTPSVRSRNSYVSFLSFNAHRLDYAAHPYRIKSSSCQVPSIRSPLKFIDLARSRFRERSIRSPICYLNPTFPLNSRAQVTIYATGLGALKNQYPW